MIELINNIIRITFFLFILCLTGYVLMCEHKVYENFLSLEHYPKIYNEKLINKEIEKRVLDEKKCSIYMGPGFDCLRVGYYCTKPKDYKH